MRLTKELHGQFIGDHDGVFVRQHLACVSCNERIRKDVEVILTCILAGGIHCLIIDRH
jgi:hypothetical protein